VSPASPANRPRRTGRCVGTRPVLREDPALREDDVVSVAERGWAERLGRRPVVGVLHPGAMGAALGSALKARAGAVVWAAAGRSQATSKRAELADLIAVPDVVALARRCDLIIAICPPHAALDVAEQVAAALGALAPSDRPLYLEANAVAPATVRRIAELLGPEQVVDGAVIGPPAWEPGQSVLWLAGRHAEPVAALFERSPFEARVLDAEPGRASALKACFALRSKALPALWLQLAAAAERAGVAEALRGELARTGTDLDRQLAEVTARVAGKAWRWAGEMDEAAATMAELGQPDGFSRAAAEIYRRASDEPRG
jgi:3-hydroxyisobutyrate dehydrogenase-like beta-hydroxyacid dehydrogenase